MGIPIYQVDAFTSKAFAGNPAGVCLLKQAADEAWMQAVAAEMNLSETAFVVPRTDGNFDLRWFTPQVEVSLCGHATLATSHILYETGTLDPDQTARYHTKSGVLTARRVDGRIELDFPAAHVAACDPPDGVLDALGLQGSPCFQKNSKPSYLIEAKSETVVRGLAPDFARLRALNVRSVIVTARADREDVDFVSRFFAPGVGIDEDPVTGSAHCVLTPYWANKLAKNEFAALQVSKRGGSLQCTLAGERVKLAGSAITVIRGELDG
jgi:PhzF family phenazine biosynthesis protein